LGFTIFTWNIFIWLRESYLDCTVLNEHIILIIWYSA